MPQMAPMNWLILFNLLVIMFMMINTLNYFSFLYKVKKSKINKYPFKLSWKW
uniref:ATP synthase complex subunit 8 n=1 Tax=Histeroidea sp. 4 KM-2017 TaxID=2219437 RepID=A0A346RHT6_9COLE|nr:ATP synthase F0 subunit 8 [Histeroidea sp. 4 KM-2017]